MAIIRTLDRRSQWGTWQGPAGGEGTRAFDDFAAVPPDARWDRSIHMRRFQGDYSQWIPGDAGTLSRAQLQGPQIYPMETMRWTEFWIRFNSVAVRVSDDFHMCVESHTPSANPGGVWTLNLSENPTVTKFRRWVGPGSFTHTWNGEAALDPGVWHHYRIGCKPSTGSTGELYYYRDNVLMYSSVGTANTTQSGTHYPEIGFYTYWSVTGTDDMNIAGFQVHDTNPGYPGGGGGPTPNPSLSIVTPTPSSSHTGTLDYNVTLTDAPSGYTLYVGLAQSGISDARAAADAPHVDSLDLSGLVGTSSQTFYAALHNSAGTLLASDTRTVTVSPDPEEPPPATDLSGSMTISVDFSGNLVPASVPEVTRVAQIGQETVSYRRPLFFEILEDGTVGQRVVWNSANARFEPFDLQE